MGNAIVYSFHLRSGTIEQLRCYQQLKYSIDTLRKFNKEILVYVYVSPSSTDTSGVNFDDNVTIVKFDVIDDGGWKEDWVSSGFLEFLKHRWENAIKAVHSYNLDNVLYLDTDTVFHGDPEVLFKKHGSTSHMWAKPDNSNDLMAKVEVWPGMNDGQFIMSKELASNDILTHMKFYVNHILSKNKHKLTDQEYSNLSWVSTQYAVWDYFEHQKNSVRHFDDKEVMLHIEPEHNDTSSLILHHYYNSNTEKFVPKEYL